MTDTKSATTPVVPDDVVDGQILSESDGYQLIWHTGGTITRIETPDGTAQTQRLITERIHTALDTLEAASLNWDTLTNIQKDTALRLTVRTVAKLARLQLSQYDKTGD